MALYRTVGLVGLVLSQSCAAAPTATSPASPKVPEGGPPPFTARTAPLRLSVVYPAATDQIDARDSTFLLGSVGTGGASLTINGLSVPVAPNGAWLAWLAIPADSLIQFELVARTATDSTTLIYPVRRVPRFRPPAGRVWLDSTSFSPGGRIWWPANEFLPISLRAAEGATVRLKLPDGSLVPLVAELSSEEIPWGIRAFDRDTGNLLTPRRPERYVGTLRGKSLGENPGPFIPVTPAPGSSLTPEPASRRSTDSVGPIVVEAIAGADTARATWHLRLALLDSLPQLIEFNDDPTGKGGVDSLTVGRARPGGTYHWFFPTGTRTVASGRLGDDLRVRLSRGQEAWVPATDAMAIPPGSPATRATVGSITVTPAGDRFSLRVPLSQRIPFRIEEEAQRLTLRLYDAVSDINWTRYGATDSYLRDIHWSQATSDEVTITLDFTASVWGYRTRWQDGDLLLQFRRPPKIQRSRPLAGLRVVLDPGHPPLGATGPSGLRESQANLAVSLRLRDLLQQSGATVILTRSDETSVDLLPRVKLADSVDADILVSIHNNALPDGVNPFSNNGSSVFYNHPRSLPLAQAVQRELVRQLKTRDLGVGRGDLALVRPSWMPAILTEGLFMMIPEQEAALASAEGQQRYAVAVRDGLVAFLQGVAAKQPPDVP